jgi:hypothetical protein
MKKFLTAFGVIAASFAAAHTASATAPASSIPQPAATQANSAVTQVDPSGRVTVRDGAGDLFNFVLKRSGDTGVMMAEHESHASHGSHGSHRSHYSSRS